jgi:hypothetical protein
MSVLTLKPHWAVLRHIGSVIAEEMDRLTAELLEAVPKMQSLMNAAGR